MPAAMTTSTGLFICNSSCICRGFRRCIVLRLLYTASPPVARRRGGRTIWNALRVALRIISGKKILNFAFVALCGALQTHFHGRGREGKQQLPCLFPAETSARRSTPSVCSRWSQPPSPRGRQPSQSSLRDASSPEGGAFGHLPVSSAKPPPFGGGGTAQAVTERVRLPLASPTPLPYRIYIERNF